MKLSHQSMKIFMKLPLKRSLIYLTPSQTLSFWKFNLCNCKVIKKKDKQFSLQATLMSLSPCRASGASTIRINNFGTFLKATFLVLWFCMKKVKQKYGSNITGMYFLIDGWIFIFQCFRSIILSLNRSLLNISLAVVPNFGL